MPDVILEFMVFYFGVSIALVIIFFLFKKIIFTYWFLAIPLIFAGIIFFPFGLIMFGYFLRVYDERREKRNFYSEEEYSDDTASETIETDIKW